MDGKTSGSGGKGVQVGAGSGSKGDGGAGSGSGRSPARLAASEEGEAAGKEGVGLGDALAFLGTLEACRTYMRGACRPWLGSHPSSVEEVALGSNPQHT